MIAGLIAAYVGAVGVGRRAVWRRRTVESVGRADAKRPAGTRSRRRRESDSEGVQREPERRERRGAGARMAAGTGAGGALRTGEGVSHRSNGARAVRRALRKWHMFLL